MFLERNTVMKRSVLDQLRLEQEAIMGQGFKPGSNMMFLMLSDGLKDQLGVGHL
jgi:hypothetical protein